MKLASLAFAGVAAAALAGTAIAANQKSHQMDVPLADGSVVHVEYEGDVAPRVTLAGPVMAGADFALDVPVVRWLRPTLRRHAAPHRRDDAPGANRAARNCQCRLLRKLAGGSEQRQRRLDQQWRRDLHAHDRGRLARSGQGSEGDDERQRRLRRRRARAARTPARPHLTAPAARTAARNADSSGLRVASRGEGP